MADATVRPADEGDALLLAELQIQLWQHAYAELLPASVLFTDPAEHARAWAARIATGRPVLIATEGDQPVGFAAVGIDPEGSDTEGPALNRPATAQSRTAEGSLGAVEVLGVLPRWSRRGHGGRLLGEAARCLRGLGAARGCWWAPETDTTIASFLGGVGWLPDGHRRVLDTGESLLGEVRYLGSLELALV